VRAHRRRETCIHRARGMRASRVARGASHSRIAQRESGGARPTRVLLLRSEHVAPCEPPGRFVRAKQQRDGAPFRSGRGAASTKRGGENRERALTEPTWATRLGRAACPDSQTAPPASRV
jgi:hypothetical protein